MSQHNIMKARSCICIGLFSLLAACTSIPEDESRTDQARADEIVVKDEPLSKTGNAPYVVDGILYEPMGELDGFTQQGIASWYGTQFHGKKTSSGEEFDMYQYSAAHKILPIPSYIRVTNLANNKSMVVRVNDRGPFVGARVLDLSYAAARKLDFASAGTTPVKIESLSVITPSGDGDAGANDSIYIQTGVFSQQLNALQAKRDLESRGYKARVDQREDSLYTVKVGPFATARLALTEKQGLEKSMRQTMMLVTEN